MLPRYSYSALNTYRTCPRKFKFHYLDKVDVPKKVTADTYMGNATHRVLSRLYKFGADGVVYPVNNMLMFYQEQWEKVERQFITLIDDQYTVDDYIRMGQQMLIKHYERYKPFDPGTLLGTELHLRLSLPDTPFKFTTIIDRLWKRDDGVIEICDFKTGRSLVRPQDPTFIFQMGLYQLAVQENYSQFEEIELAQYFLRMDEVVKYRMRPDELERLAEDIRVAVIETIDAERLNNFPPKESHFCNYCDYVMLCPAKKHESMLQEQENREDDSSETPQQKAYALATRFIDVDRKKKQLDAEWTSLRAEIVQLAKDMNMTRFAGDAGTVHVSLSRKEEFVTKTEDSRAFAELSHLARQFGLEAYFTLDDKTLMKEIYQKRRLTEEQLAKLKQFVQEKERAVVSARLKKGIEPIDE